MIRLECFSIVTRKLEKSYNHRLQEQFTVMALQVSSQILLIRSEIDEMLNQLKHLERSQNELREAILRDGDDEEFRLALIENEQVIQNKNEKLSKLKEKLGQIDPAFRSEVAARERLPIQVNFSTQSNGLPQLPALTSEIITSTNVEASSDGFYL